MENKGIALTLHPGTQNDKMETNFLLGLVQKCR